MAACVTARVRQGVGAEMGREAPGDMSLNDCARALARIAFTRGTNGHSLGDIYHHDENEDTEVTQSN